MKKLESSLFKFEQNKIGNLAKVVGGAPVSTTWEQTNVGCGWDTLETGCSNGYTVSVNGGPSQPCDFVITKDPRPFVITQSFR